jgi:hypothetical protein
MDESGHMVVSEQSILLKVIRKKIRLKLSISISIATELITINFCINDACLIAQVFDD